MNEKMNEKMKGEIANDKTPTLTETLQEQAEIIRAIADIVKDIDRKIHGPQREPEPGEEELSPAQLGIMEYAQFYMRRLNDIYENLAWIQRRL